MKSIWEIICAEGLSRKRNHTKYVIDMGDCNVFTMQVSFLYWKYNREEDCDFAQIKAGDNLMIIGEYFVEATPTCLWLERSWV